MKLYTQDEVDEFVRDAKYKSTNHSYGCFACGSQGNGKQRHLVLFCDEHMHFLQLMMQMVRVLKDAV